MDCVTGVTNTRSLTQCVRQQRGGLATTNKSNSKEEEESHPFIIISTSDARPPGERRWEKKITLIVIFFFCTQREKHNILKKKKKSELLDSRDFFLLLLESLDTRRRCVSTPSSRFFSLPLRTAVIHILFLFYFFQSIVFFCLCGWRHFCFWIVFLFFFIPSDRRHWKKIIKNGGV